MKKLTALGISTASLLSLVPNAFAAVQDPINPCPVGGNAGGLGFDRICSLDINGGIIGAIIAIVFVIAVLIALAFLIVGGIRWILSGGDKGKVEAARGTIVAALVGLVLVFLSFFIINFLLGIFGLESIQHLKIPDLTPATP